MNYKNSGIEWIGDIPEHWDVIKIKYLFNDYAGNGFSEFLQGQSDGDYPFYKVSDISHNGKYVEKSNNYVSSKNVIDNKWNVVPKNSIIAAKIGEALKKNHRKINIVDCIIDNNCIALTPKEIGKEYSYYLLCLIDFDWFTNPGAVPSVSMERLKNLFVCTPPLSEQILIANFLDDKTAKIDSLIEKKKKLIELYKEERTAVINQAVTRGINPNVKLKPSGIDWLGEIPEHWNFGSLKWNSKIYSGGTPSRMNSDYWKDGTIPWLNSGTVNQIFITEPSEFITEQALNESSAKWIPKYSIVIALAGQGKTKGMAAQILLDTTCNQSMAAIIPNQRFENRFLLYWLQRNYQNIRNLGGGDLRDGLNLEMIGSIKTPIPPMTEQSQIIEEIETEATRIDEKIVEIEKEIELLQEYRTALISEVVTGKIKV